MDDTTRYRAVAVLALIGLFLSTYLLLYSMGYYGDILCGTGACEVVQTSEYAEFLGIPVSAWGTAWYAAVLGVALVAAAGSTGVERDRLPTLILAMLATGGLAFSGYLTWIEAFVLEAWCRWCVASAALTVLIFLFAAPWRVLRRGKQTAEA